MLSIHKTTHLAFLVGAGLEELIELANDSASYSEELQLVDPTRPDKKPRIVLDVHARLRRIQSLINRNILQKKLSPSQYSFGGVRGRNIKMNAEVHRNSKFGFCCDVSNFYPSISSQRVYRFFYEGQNCSPDVSRLLTKLCTYNYHLALGLITSPFLADQIIKPLDRQIAGMAQKAGLVYSRFVDDISLSGSYDIGKSGIPNLLKRILKKSGFTTNNKDQFGAIGDDDFQITKLRVNKGRIDIAKKYHRNLLADLAAHRSLALGGEMNRPYQTKSQFWGKVQYVTWIRRGRRLALRRKFGTINWEQAEREARSRGLVVARKKLVPI